VRALLVPLHAMRRLRYDDCQKDMLDLVPLTPMYEETFAGYCRSRRLLAVHAGGLLSGGSATRAASPERPAAAQTAERDYDLNRAAELKYGTLLQLQRQLKEAEEELAAKVRRQRAPPACAPARSPTVADACPTCLPWRMLAPHACPPPPHARPLRWASRSAPREAAVAAAQVQGARMLREEVTEADIADIISKWTGIPVSKLVASEREKLLHLDAELHRRVIGQDEAVQAVADAIQRCARTGGAH